MRITTTRERTVGELLDDIRSHYSSEEDLRAYVSANPDDAAARMALHDLREYQALPQAETSRETLDMVTPDEPPT